jgi:hypothetical protein
MSHTPAAGELPTGKRVCVGPNQWTQQNCGAGKVALVIGAVPGGQREWSCIPDPRQKRK